MNILICDDELAFGEQVERAVVPFFAGRRIPAQCKLCASAEEVQALPDLAQYQIAFLDVDLVTASGIELGRTLRQANPRMLLVYISAYMEFALDGYTVSAFRYILKSDLSRMLPACLEDIYNELAQKRKVLSVKEVGGEMRRLPYDDIFSLESEGRKVAVFGEGARKALCIYYGKLSGLPEEMFDSGFLRVSRSVVVNMRYISRINSYKVRMLNGSEHSVSRASYADVRGAWLEWRGRFGDV